MTDDAIAGEQPSLLPDEQAAPAAEAFGIDLVDLERQARAFVQQRPVVAVLAAAGVGYLLARLARVNR